MFKSITTAAVTDPCRLTGLSRSTDGERGMLLSGSWAEAKANKPSQAPQTHLCPRADQFLSCKSPSRKHF